MTTRKHLVTLFLISLLVTFLSMGVACNESHDQVICPKELGSGGECRFKLKESANQTTEQVLDSVQLNNQVGIYMDYFGNPPEPQIVNGTGFQPYPDDYTVKVPLGPLNFKTERNTSSDCGSFGYRCTGTLEDVTLAYTVDGQTYTRLVGIEVNGTIDGLKVDDNSLKTWTSLIQANFNKDGSAIYFEQFWFHFRVIARNLNLGEFDPIADQFGAQTKTVIANAIFLAFKENFPYNDVGEIAKISVRHLYPNNDAGGGTADENFNPSAQATQDAINVHQAEILATQEAIVCNEYTDEALRVLCLQAVVDRLNGTSSNTQVIIPVNPREATSVPPTIEPATPSPTP